MLPWEAWKGSEASRVWPTRVRQAVCQGPAHQRGRTAPVWAGPASFGGDQGIQRSPHSARPESTHMDLIVWEICLGGLGVGEQGETADRPKNSIAWNAGGA